MLEGRTPCSRTWPLSRRHGDSRVDMLACFPLVLPTLLLAPRSPPPLVTSSTHHLLHSSPPPLITSSTHHLLHSSPPPLVTASTRGSWKGTLSHEFTESRSSPPRSSPPPSSLPPSRAPPREGMRAAGLGRSTACMLWPYREGVTTEREPRGWCASWPDATSRTSVAMRARSLSVLSERALSLCSLCSLCSLRALSVLSVLSVLSEACGEAQQCVAQGG